MTFMRVGALAALIVGCAGPAAAQAVKYKVAKTMSKPVATMILPQATFYMGEAYHQDYATKNHAAYMTYRIGCGRDRALKAVWGGR